MLNLLNVPQLLATAMLLLTEIGYWVSALMPDGCDCSHSEIVKFSSTSSGGSIGNSQSELSTRSSNYSSAIFTLTLILKYSSNTRNERPDGRPLPHSGRQVGTYWHLPPLSHGHLEDYHCRESPRSSQVPYWDVGGVAEESGPFPHLVCHH